MDEWKLILRSTDAIVTSICDILEDKMMREAQIEVRMNTEFSVVLCERCLISRTTLSLMINERYAIISCDPLWRYTSFFRTQLFNDG